MYYQIPKNSNVKRIIIIRHCDKTITNNYTTEWDCDDQGFVRAKLLAGFTELSWKKTQNCYNPIFGLCLFKDFWSKYTNKIDSIFAPISTFNKSVCQISNRMCLIMEPTAYCHGIKINVKNNQQVSYCVSEYRKFVDFIEQNCENTVLIAYEHEHIPPMINYMFEKSIGRSNIVPAWPLSSSDRFDLVFIIDNPFTTNISLTITTQEFNLKGDSLMVPNVYKHFVK